MDNIRITSGTLRGRVIKSPQSHSTHPMGAREKLALFNMISGYLPSSRVLDAFAGSGALGIEAFSRGAREVIFVEKSPRAARVIKQNLLELGLQAQVLVGDIKNFGSSRISDLPFDLVLVDPPYDDFKIELVAGLAKFVKNGGVLVLSHPGEAPEIPGLKLIKTSQYARAHISLYAK